VFEDQVHEEKDFPQNTGKDRSLFERQAWKDHAFYEENIVLAQNISFVGADSLGVLYDRATCLEQKLEWTSKTAIEFIEICYDL